MTTVLDNLSLFLFGVLLPVWILFRIVSHIFNKFRKYHSPADGKMPGPWKKAGLVVWLVFMVLVVFVGYVLLLGILRMEYALEGSFLLMFGWIPFLIEKFPQITPNWEGLAMALTSLAFLVFGGHWFLRWLYNHWGDSQASDFQKSWPIRWTLGLVALLVLFFSASIGFIGATHQTAWMIGANTSMTKSSWGGGYNSYAKSNLHNVYLACKAYWADHDSKNSCTREFYKSTTYGYIQSANVIVKAGGSENEFHAVAGHIDGGSWFWINPKGEISRLEIPES